MTLFSQSISISISNEKDQETFLPLHLVDEQSVLKRLNLSSEDMKAKVQPEDLSFSFLKTLVFQARGTSDLVSVMCPELP